MLESTHRYGLLRPRLPGVKAGEQHNESERAELANHAQPRRFHGAEAGYGTTTVSPGFSEMFCWRLRRRDTAL